ncbi:MAG: hypothetical protein RLZZ210_1065 [Pseudomonadota bacterium]|jgi:hypothetical protein
MPSATISYGASRTSATTRTDSFRDVDLEKGNGASSTSSTKLTATGVASSTVDYSINTLSKFGEYFSSLFTKSRNNPNPSSQA